MARHRLEPTRETLHGHFSPSLPPALTIDGGDEVEFRTLDARWHVERMQAPGGPAAVFDPRDDQLDAGHALTGPVHVRGAEPGGTLGVEILSLRVGGWGWNTAGGFDSPVNRALGIVGGERQWLLWDLDGSEGTGTDQFGHRVRLRPFLGVMGMPPAEAGIYSTAPPRRTGGNIDCRELVPGSTLYLPVEVPGGLFSTGDGHAAQGDGEVSTTAIECPMESAVLRFTPHPDLRLRTPRATTPAGEITFGFADTLDEAMKIALGEIVDLMQQRYDVSRREALALASVVVDLHITQVVNGVVGVHAILPPDAVSQ
ncbi:MAG: acetamidase/formamidase family protein [Candidatus Dormibacteraeota bacterium]|nr:acetamidase/formamidase family protein [Candidatus Dormibacteraeota bacterium]MBO0743375.1 acetamidase/formamidase family protein [Candidatus Dormibacteraeota bacterium]